jgi:exoribonuclease II
MAISNSLPQGKWLKKKTDHWLRYKKFYMFNDATGSDHIALQAELRKAMQEAAEILEQHDIIIANMYSENVLDHRMYDNVYRIAIGFESKEDLAMAKLVLNADDFQ